MRYLHIKSVSASADFDTEGGDSYRYRLEVKSVDAPRSSRTVCVVMQNPSYAGEHEADKSVQFLEKNYETKGYDDALINPDNTHLEQNIAALKNDLERTIRKVKTFYEDFIREINFHISSRSRSGMIDTVEELQVKKETAENHVKQVIEIEQEANNNKGVGQGIIISYTRGFRNGLAAISHHSIMNRNF